MPMFANHSWRKTLFALHVRLLHMMRIHNSFAFPQWPGYEESSLPIHLRAKEVDGRPITRQILAIDVAQKIRDFMDSHIQRYALRKGCPDDQWRIAKYDGHVLGDMILTALYLYKRVWVPDLYVEW
ncbi:hypothetical protein FIBSPDRAFT_868958 [Athelia psychrophila]|uniref:Uncharacterized protein n=1 Tax=Athelia psychrophila TaxID=1759441 RepID=A0A167U1I2_9AGAM|nr:hypothetical protein FIBSPDRAFT_879413 [Fibularhizoctonia sp. CBS 109695]KZP13830.1 hypothetical protein FIBSPDRAFT_868958 [Fibularhizoctonia sp. CBS 109695]